jgi:glutathione S-transferase
MLTLYFSPGACSMASHIGIEETGASYIEKPTLLAKGEQKTDAYLKVNPRGKVPALDVDGRIIVENTAILTYLARQFPQARLLPDDPVEQARCIGMMAWFSNTVHPAYQHHMRAERFASGDVAIAAVKEMGKQAFWTYLHEINAMLEGSDWIIANHYTAADPYALVFYGWGVRGDFPVSELAAYTRFKDRMLARPAVRKVLESEKSVLLTAA